MTVWFTSDLHFDHKRMLEWRAFPSVEEMNATLVTQWRAVVQPDDLVFVLGDVFWNSRIAAEVAPMLTGRVNLVRGNHDKWPVQSSRFIDLGHYYEWSGKVDGQKQHVVLCHYPLLTWNRGHHGSWHFHGHSHGNLTGPVITREDVGIDATFKWVGSYRPVSWEELVQRLRHRTYLPVDHHRERATPPSVRPDAGPTHSGQ